LDISAAGVQVMIIEKDPKIPSVIRITEDARGPRVVLFGGVHGDELSGVHAIEKLFFDLFVGTRKLRQGSLTLARGNEQAFAAERRYLKHNLNRMFREDYGPEIDRTSYEFNRAQESVLQIATTSSISIPRRSREPFMAEQGGRLFRARHTADHDRLEQIFKRNDRGDAENYANAHGAKSATLESGSHFDKRSNDIAYRRYFAPVASGDDRGNRATAARSLRSWTSMRS
jgi:hypothetical protein